MITFVVDNQEYEADWTDGFCYIPFSGTWLTADFSNRQPENIRKVKLFVKPKKYTVAKLKTNEHSYKL